MANRSSKQTLKHVAIVRVVLTIAAFVVGCLVLASPNFAFPERADESLQKFAAGWIGFLLSYWFTD